MSQFISTKNEIDNKTNPLFLIIFSLSISLWNYNLARKMRTDIKIQNSRMENDGWIFGFSAFIILRPSHMLNPFQFEWNSFR